MVKNDSMKQADITIRRMCKEDAEEVSILEKEAFAMPWSKEAFWEMAQAPNAIYMIAVYKDKIVGNCGVRNILGEGEITNVAVSQAYRGLGISKMMMLRLMTEGKRSGIEAFTLEVRKSNIPAIRLYESLGFEISGIRPRFYERPVEDALVMWKR